MVKKQKVKMTIRNNPILRFEQVIEGFDTNFLQFQNVWMVEKCTHCVVEEKI